MWKTTTVLIGIVLILIAFGVVMLTSTSAAHGAEQFKDPLFFVKRQVIALVLAFIIGAITARLDYHVWRTFAIPLAMFSTILLVLALIPGVGLEVKGSHRWIRMGPVQFQPSELGKWAMIVMISTYIVHYQRRMRDLRRGLIFPFAVCGLTAGLIFISPDFGTTVLVVAVGMALMFVGGTRISYLLISGATGFSLFILAVMHDPVRMRRVFAFIDPEKYAQREAFQLLQAIYAFMVGGFSGVGLGQSLQKQHYLPESHNDFIFAIIGEELGFRFSLLIVLLFAGLFICGLRISQRAPDLFGRLVALGITLMISLQACMNMGVVTGSLPTKGLPLPFISYGGTSIVMTLMMVGVLINIALQAKDAETET